MEAVQGQRSNRLNYVPTLFPYVYSVNADVSNEQLIPNQLLNGSMSSLRRSDEERDTPGFRTRVEPH